MQSTVRTATVQPAIGLILAAALRADPDAIMVGERRDKERAEIGIEASLAGHLVFKPVHTNSGVETVTRLLEMGMDPFNFIGTEDIKRMSQQRAPAEDPLNIAHGQAMTTLVQDGVVKVMQGWTDFKQVKAVAIT